MTTEAFPSNVETIEFGALPDRSLGALAQAGIVDVSYAPMSLLPPTDKPSSALNPFWTRRMLRPEAWGPNTHNIPLFYFGIDYNRETARLSVPSTQWLNAVADEYAPEGVGLVQYEGRAPANVFLSMLAEKQFPATNYVTLNSITLRTDNMLEDPTVMDAARAEGHLPLHAAYEKSDIFIATNDYEHGLVDHGAVVTMPQTEADKLARFIDSARRIRVLRSKSEYDANVTRCIDRLLNHYSSYAFCSRVDPTRLDIAAADYFKRLITNAQAEVNAYTAGTILEPLALDFEQLDASIESFQRAA